MSLTVNTNVAAIEAQRYLQQTEGQLSTTMEQLSSGLRVNIAANDVAGYAISEELEGQINGTNQAVENVQDGVALAQTAQGALNTVEQILQRIRTLAVQYQNGTNSEEAKSAIEGQVKQLVSAIAQIGETTKFNGVTLLDEAGSITFQVGANKGEVLSVSTVKLFEGLKIENVAANLKEAAVLNTISEAIKYTAEQAAAFGSVQNRMQYVSANLEVYSQNLAAANSGIRDANMAEASAAFAKEQILQQTGVAVLAQANALPQAVLKLV